MINSNFFNYTIYFKYNTWKEPEPESHDPAKRSNLGAVTTIEVVGGAKTRLVWTFWERF